MRDLCSNYCIRAFTHTTPNARSPQNIHIGEWMELGRLEDEEYAGLEKKHGIEIKRLNKNLKWGKYVTAKLWRLFIFCWW